MSELSEVIEYDKPEHDEWHPVYMEHCGYCRSERALPSCRAALEEYERQRTELRAFLAKAIRYYTPHGVTGDMFDSAGVTVAKEAWRIMGFSTEAEAKR